MIRKRLRIAAVHDLAPGRTLAFRFGPSNAILLNDCGTLKAYVNRCSHMGGPVELVSGGEIFRCRWHQAEFDPKTGEAVLGEAPAGTRLQAIPLEIEDGQIYAMLELSEEF